MSNLNKKLLAEAFDAYVNEGDIAKATRLFQRHWDLSAKNQYALLESEDEEFEVTDMGDDFNQDVAAEAGSDEEQKFEQLQIAVDELEDKYPVEMTDEVQAKFDDLRNKIDELKLAGEDGEVSDEDATVIIEDLKADFEVAGEISEDVQALFDEISAGIQGEEADTEEIDVADEDEEDEISDEEPVEEAAEEPVEGEEETDLDIDFSEEEPTAEEGEESDEEPVEVEGEDESEDLDIIYDAKEKVDELLAKLDELEANEKAEEGEDVEAPAESDKEEVKEEWTKAKLPRNKLQNEEEGVKKEGMKFGKATSIPVRKGMGVSHTVSAGTSADKKVKVEKTENKGAKSWSKVAKPANDAKAGKSVLGN